MAHPLESLKCLWKVSQQRCLEFGALDGEFRPHTASKTVFGWCAFPLFQHKRGSPVTCHLPPRLLDTSVESWETILHLQGGRPPQRGHFQCYYSITLSFSRKLRVSFVGRSTFSAILTCHLEGVCKVYRKKILAQLVGLDCHGEAGQHIKSVLL